MFTCPPVCCSYIAGRVLNNSRLERAGRGLRLEMAGRGLAGREMEGSGLGLAP